MKPPKGNCARYWLEQHDIMKAERDAALAANAELARRLADAQQWIDSEPEWKAEFIKLQTATEQERDAFRNAIPCDVNCATRHSALRGPCDCWKSRALDAARAKDGKGAA